MVVFTDGWSNKGPDPGQMAKEALRQQFELYSVAIKVGFLGSAGQVLINSWQEFLPS